jgi:hypothetical protein
LELSISLFTNDTVQVPVRQVLTDLYEIIKIICCGGKWFDKELLWNQFYVAQQMHPSWCVCEGMDFFARLLKELTIWNLIVEIQSRTAELKLQFWCVGEGMHFCVCLLTL